MLRYTSATRTALNLAAKATKLTESELSEILIRRYLPALLVDIKSELGDNAERVRICEFAAKNTERNCRHVGILIRSARTKKGWSQQKTADAIGWTRRNYQKIEQGCGRSCTRNQATKLAIAFQDEDLTNHLQQIGWWRGAEM